RRHRDHEILAAGPLLVGSFAVVAAFGPEVLRPQGTEVTPGGVTFEQHAAAVASVAAVGSAARDVRFPPEGDRAVTAAATLNVNFRFVVQHRTRLWPPALS